MTIQRAARASRAASGPLGSGASAVGARAAASNHARRRGGGCA